MEEASSPQRSHPGLTVWPALLLAPLLALGHLSLAYSLVTPSCAHQDSAGLHTLGAVSLVLALGMTLLAWRTWSGLAGKPESAGAVTQSETGHAESRPRFLALLATLVGALSSLVVFALWLPVWILPPCT